LQRDQFGVIAGVAIFVMRNEPDRSLGATEPCRAFGAEAWMVDAKMEPVEQSVVRRVCQALQEARRRLPEQYARDSVDCPDVAMVADFAEVMQQSRRQQVLTGAVTPQPFAHREQMNLIVGRQCPKRVGLWRRENARQHFVAIPWNAAWPEGACTLI
jgi:hypothetical protein